MDIVGTRGFKGKKALNARSQFDNLKARGIFYEVEDEPYEEPELDERKLDQLENA
jgi:hypothetical protein